MVKVITYGSYDMLHYGHIRLLERAKALGDYLIVGVTSDDYDKTRGKINLQQTLMERVEAVRATGIPDEVIVEEYEGQKIDDIRNYGVDIFTVGSDWKGYFDYLSDYCKVVYLDRTEGVSSTEIRSRQIALRMGVVGSAKFIEKMVAESDYVNGIEVVGIHDGYKGLVEGLYENFERHSVSETIDRGGTILGSARLPEFVDEAVQKRGVEKLKENKIDAVVVIGGDGTYRGADALTKLGVNCIALPGTIDNDIEGTDYTIGFDTALNTIVECVDKLRDTSNSHHRCSVVEVMGNRCGDLAIYSGISCGAEILITPETGYDEEAVLEKLRYLENSGKSHAIVIVSEKVCDVKALADTWAPRQSNCWLPVSAAIVWRSRTTRSSQCRFRNASRCLVPIVKLSTGSSTDWSDNREITRSPFFVAKRKDPFRIFSLSWMHRRD